MKIFTCIQDVSQFELRILENDDVRLFIQYNYVDYDQFIKDIKVLTRIFKEELKKENLNYEFVPDWLYLTKKGIVFILRKF